MGSSGRILTSADILDGSIMNVDVNTAAAIAGSKLGAGSVTPDRLYGGGTANRALVTVDGGNVVAAEVITAMIAADAITQLASSALTPGQATTSTSNIDATGSSITITTTTGEKVLFLATGAIYNLTAGFLTILEANSDGVDGTGSVFTSSTASSFGPFVLASVAAPSAGSHTYKIRWRVNGGTGTINNGTLWIIGLKK